MLLFWGILAGVTFAGAKLALQVKDVLPEVGRDAQGDDPWTDPVGVEAAGPFQVVHIPDCAAGPVTRIILMDERSNPYWRVSGPPAALNTFVVGVTPKGFTVDVPFRKPANKAVLRLVVIRKVKGAAGVRYTARDLREKRVVSMLPLTRFTVAGFQTADVCGKATKDGKDTATTATTIG